MTILEKLQQATPSFEETFEKSYSHGLENIYALETVDIKSVRKISESEPKKVEVHHQPVSEPTGQFELDLGNEYRNWIEPFLLNEPIKVLELTRSAEHSLQEHDKNYLKDIVGADLRDFVTGQGHIDEIQSKLSDYIRGRPTERAYHLEFNSWLKSLFATIDQKKAKVFLDSYQLGDLITLSKAENVEVKQLSFERRLQWIEEVRQELLGRADEVDQEIKKVTEVFVISWMRGRLGMATEAHLYERLQSVSESPEITDKAINFFRNVFCNGEFPLNKHLIQVDYKLFCSDKHFAESYNQVIEKSLTYFYKPTLSYPLPDLKKWVEREFATTWKGFNEGFLEKALRLSSQFRVRKGSAGHLVVRLA